MKKSLRNSILYFIAAIIVLWTGISGIIDPGDKFPLIAWILEAMLGVFALSASIFLFINRNRENSDNTTS